MQFNIPPQRVPFVDETGRVTREWYRWLVMLEETSSNGIAGNLNDILNLVAGQPRGGDGADNRNTIEDLRALTLILPQTRNDPPKTVPTIYQDYLAGCQLTAISTTAITISPGQATSDDNTTFMALLASFGKTSAAWAVGSGNGGLDTGAIGASSWYHVFIIERPDTGNVDALISLSATAPTMPTNYTKKRRIFSIRTDGANHFITVHQDGDWFTWDAPVGDVNGTFGATAVNQTLSVPAGINTVARFHAAGTRNTAWSIVFWDPNLPVQATGVPAGNFSLQGIASDEAAGDFQIRTNLISQIASVADAATTTLQIATTGWIDTRGRFT